MVLLNVDDLLKRHYPESEYGGFSDVDGTVAFYSRVRALLTPCRSLSMLAAAGEASSTSLRRFRAISWSLRGSCAKVIGIDVDEAAATNQLIDEFRLVESSVMAPRDRFDRIFASAIGWWSM